MPVIGTPVTSTSSSFNYGSFITEPSITTVYNTPIISKMRAVSVKQSQYASTQIQLLHPDTSLPLDLTVFGLNNGVGPQGPQGPQSTTSWVQVRFSEAVNLDGCVATGVTQTIVNASSGIIQVLVPSSVATNPGVYICESGVFDPANNFLFSNSIYLFVERGLFPSFATSTAPLFSGAVGAPTLQEIRISLRDEPELNRLIATYEFDIADICDGLVRAVHYFNMSQPPLRVAFDTRTFPWRFQWLDGMAATLFEYAGNYYRRSHLKHQAGGVSIDDLDREREYLQAWQIRNERWTKWVQQKRMELNMQEGFGSFSSGYPGVEQNWQGGW